MFWVDAELGSDLYLDGKIVMAHGYVSILSLLLSPFFFCILLGYKYVNQDIYYICLSVGILQPTKGQSR